MDNDKLTQHMIDLEGKYNAQQEQIKTMFKQIADIRTLSNSVHDLATSVALLAQAQKEMSVKVDDLSDDVDEIKARPGKAWDKVISVIITAVVTAVVTFLATRSWMT